MRVLAYRLQSDAFGDLDKSIRRSLRSDKDDGAGVPFDRRAPQTRQGVALKAGALLVREWKGRLERVMREFRFLRRADDGVSASRSMRTMTPVPDPRYRPPRMWYGSCQRRCEMTRPSMSNFDAYLRAIEEEMLPELRSELVLLESGGEHRSHREGFGPWVDTTQRDRQRLKKSIAAYEGVLAGHRVR